MSYVKFWAHVVWGTKSWEQVINDNYRFMIYEHIKENAVKKGIYLDCINGGKEHIHCLISLEPKQNVAEVLRLLKGESSNWIGKQPGIKKFWKGWADDYCAISVSPSIVNKVRNYIKNQEIHHRKVTFNQEWEEFVKAAGFVVGKDGSATSNGPR